MVAFSEQFWAGILGVTIAGVFGVIIETIRRKGTKQVQELVRDTNAETKINGGKTLRDDIKNIGRVVQNIERRLGTIDDRQLVMEDRLSKFDERLIKVTDQIVEIKPSVEKMNTRIDKMTNMIDPGHRSG